MPEPVQRDFADDGGDRRRVQQLGNVGTRKGRPQQYLAVLVTTSWAQPL